MTKINKPTQIKTVSQLKKASPKDGGADFFILLNGNCRSSKHISWDGEKFVVLNEIDSSEQELTPEELFDEAHTNIGKAMKAGAFYKYNF